MRIKYARDMEALKALIVAEGIDIWESTEEVADAVERAGIEPWDHPISNVRHAIRDLRVEQWDAAQAASVAEEAEAMLRSITGDGV